MERQLAIWKVPAEPQEPMEERCRLGLEAGLDKLGQEEWARCILELQEAERYRLGREEEAHCKLESEHCSSLEEKADSNSHQ